MDKETEKTIIETLKGIRITAIEKILVLGPEEAKEDLEQLRNMTKEIIRFWDLFSGYLKTYDIQIEKVIKEINL